jgi:CRISPR-associated protein Cmr4
MKLCAQSKLPLEAFEFEAREDALIQNIAESLEQMVFPEHNAYRFFAERMKKALVLLSDEDFGYFVRNATVVEPHVRIDDDTGTAKDGGLFYTENLPPESILLGVVMASDERKKGENRLPAKDVLETVLKGMDGLKGLDSRLVQVGGDATTGRGQVVLKSVGGNEDA